MGGFFARLAKHLSDSGARVYKINFNGGDWYYYYGHSNTTNYRGSPEAWPDFIGDFLQQHEIKRIFLFGDCRYYHREAIKAARESGVEVYVFEEGYVRPHYITLERGGVNGYTSLPRSPEFFLSQSQVIIKPAKPTGTYFRHMAFAAVGYYLAAALLSGFFPHYEHHKSFSVLRKGRWWLLSGMRKCWYDWKDQRVDRQLSSGLSNKYFLVPLQVNNDSQIYYHSDYEKVEAFIADVIESFARHAPSEMHLVFKHHPMDRGSRHYGKLIASLGHKHGVESRLIYTHQIDLASALKHALGVVVINSTAGLSSLQHGIPVKVTGRAIYDMPGLTYQEPLNDFWKRPGKVSLSLLHAFQVYLISTTQLNGSFYGCDPFPIALPLHGEQGQSGLSSARPQHANQF